jgi:hypothetical protein
MRILAKRVERWIKPVAAAAWVCALVFAQGKYRDAILIVSMSVFLFVYLGRRSFLARRPVDREFHRPLFFILVAVFVLVAWAIATG